MRQPAVETPLTIFAVEPKALCNSENPLDNPTCLTFTRIPETMFWCATTLTTGQFSKSYVSETSNAYMNFGYPVALHCESSWLWS